jgi:hypothetical protein
MGKESMYDEIQFKTGNEKLIKVLPNAADRLLGLLRKQGREALVLCEWRWWAGAALVFNTKWIWSMARQTETSSSLPAMCGW